MNIPSDSKPVILLIMGLAVYETSALSPQLKQLLRVHLTL